MDGRSEGKQNERHEADRFAKQINLAKQDVSQSCTGRALRMAEGPQGNYAAFVESLNPFPPRLRFTPSVCPSPRFSRRLEISQGRATGK